MPPLSNTNTVDHAVEEAYGFPSIMEALNTPGKSPTGAKFCTIDFVTNYAAASNHQYFQFTGFRSPGPIAVGTVVILDSTFGGAIRLTNILYANPIVGWLLFSGHYVHEPPHIPMSKVASDLDSYSPASRLRRCITMCDSMPTQASIAIPIRYDLYPKKLRDAMLHISPYLFDDELTRDHLAHVGVIAPPAPPPTTTPNLTCGHSSCHGDTIPPIFRESYRRMRRQELAQASAQAADTTLEPRFEELHVDKEEEVVENEAKEGSELEDEGAIVVDASEGA